MALATETPTEVFAEPDSRFTPYLRERDPLADAIPVSEAAQRFWEEQGDKAKGITSFDAYCSAKLQFEQDDSGHRTAAVLGGGFGGMRMAAEIRKKYPDVHVVIFEKSSHIGGMAVTAISPFVEAHGKTKISTFRTGLKLLMDPGVDMITEIEIEDRDVSRLTSELGFQVVIDARGSDPKDLDIPYGDGVLSVNQYLDMVNRAFDEDGHFGNVHVPWARRPDGTPYATLIVAGGNAGPDLQKANELALLVDELRRIHGIDPRTVNIGKIAADGVRNVREQLGLVTTELDHSAVASMNGRSPKTLIFYRGALGYMDVAKRLKGAGHLKRGDRELQTLIVQLAKDWEKEDGGWYVGNREVVAVARAIDGSLSVTLHDTANDPPEAKEKPELKDHAKDYAIQLGLVVGAVGFKKLTRIPGTFHVGIRVEGKGDLAATGDSVRDVKEKVFAAIEASASHAPGYRSVLDLVRGFQTTRRTRYTDGTSVDPVLHQMRKAPKALIAKGFRMPKLAAVAA